MANPIFSRSSTFSRPAQYAPSQAAGYGQGATYGQGPMAQTPYGQVYQPQAPAAVMTYDDVIAKTGISLFLVALTAFLGYQGLSRGIIPLGMGYGAMMLSAFAALITVFVVAGRAKISPVGVLIYAVLEGFFIGGLTYILAGSTVGGTQLGDLPVQAVTATFAAAACTLGAYRFFNIRVTSKMRQMVFITTASFAGLMLINFVLSIFGISTGLLSAGPLGIGIALIGAALAVFNLIIDFDAVDRGVANQAPASESWRAALGITVTMVWLYTEILRLLSYLQRR